MVATRGRKRAAEQEEEQEQPPVTDYERTRDARVAENEAKLAALGLKTFVAKFNNSFPRSANGKGGKSANKKTSSEDSDTSEYLLENDDQGDSDDDETESQAQPQPIKSPPGFRRKLLCSKRKKGGANMPPGVRASKRVRATPGSLVQTPTPQLRASKRLQLAAIDGQIEEEGNGAGAQQGSGAGAEQANAAGAQDIAAAEEDRGADAQEGGAGVDEDNVATGDDTQAPVERAPREPRPPTKGAHLNKLTKSMGQRLPIAVAEGKRRPHDPVQAAKFASESGIIIRDSIPILPHWKDYKKNKKHYNDYEGKLAGRIAINTDNGPTKEACTDMFRGGTRQMRHRMKKKFFDGKPANEIPTTSPVPYMTDAEWLALTTKWTNPKNMETCQKNKINRGKVKYHQTTGSRCYVAHLHEFKKNRNNAEPSTQQDEELDLVEAFTTCHTSSKKGLSEPARDAVSNMEALRAEPVAEGEAALSSVQVVSQVLTKNSSKGFLKSLGIKPVGSSTSVAPNESELREQLAAEARAAVQGELDTLKKRSEEADEKLERQQREMEEMKKQAEMTNKEMQENNIMLRRLLNLNNISST